ncbi:hypothetical protein DL767_006918 [Monosporascus sp. MG133]|nr:hypothetical protein DL767_006918 [Monosporascus sp. MG133]
MEGYKQIPNFDFGPTASIADAFANYNPTTIDLLSGGQQTEERFTRLDTLNRHISTQSEDTPQYPCCYCYDRQGKDGFRRFDDLLQHLKGYHKINTVEVLSKHKPRGVSGATTCDTAMPGETPAPSQQVGLGVPPFPCPVLGCIKGGANGYVRWVDLFEHQNMMHSFDSFGVGAQDYASMPQVLAATQTYQLSGDLDFQL